MCQANSGRNRRWPESLERPGSDGTGGWRGPALLRSTSDRRRSRTRPHGPAAASPSSAPHPDGRCRAPTRSRSAAASTAGRAGPRGRRPRAAAASIRATSPGSNSPRSRTRPGDRYSRGHPRQDIREAAITRETQQVLGRRRIALGQQAFGGLAQDVLLLAALDLHPVGNRERVVDHVEIVEGRVVVDAAIGVEPLVGRVRIRLAVQVVDQQLVQAARDG